MAQVSPPRGRFAHALLLPPPPLVLPEHLCKPLDAGLTSGWDRHKEDGVHSCTDLLGSESGTIALYCALATLMGWHKGLVPVYR